MIIYYYLFPFTGFHKLHMMNQNELKKINYDIIVIIL